MPNFKSYTRLGGWLDKVTTLLREFEWGRFRDYPIDALHRS